MKRLLASLMLLLGTLPAKADTTDLAQQPLQNMSVSGVVKPNLMLLYDNSGSMLYQYTPDYIVNGETCRDRATMSRTRGCVMGDAPYTSPDFNRQYYDPKVRFSPPVRANGTSYSDMNAALTADWTRVPTDGYGINKTDLLQANRDTTDLVKAFPDIQWCDTNGNNCGRNTTGYTYPTNTVYSRKYIDSNPYYYTINVAEYCTDRTMTKCVTTAVNADPPAGYPVAAKVRFCDSTALTNCQAKFVGNFKYPRFSGVTTVAPWWGTITINASIESNRRTIRRVTAAGPLGEQVITVVDNKDESVVAASGTDTDAKRSQVASALAASIVAKTGSNYPYTACVRTPTVTGVQACSTFGITLGATETNVVAVIPVTCPAGASKAAGTCTPVTDGSRAGDSLMVLAGTGSTSLLTVSGTANKSTSQILKDVKLNGVSLFTTSLTLAKNASANDVAAAIQNQIKTRGSVTAYVGGSANSSTICQAAAKNVVCLINTANNSEGHTITLGDLNNNTTGGKTNLTLTTTKAVSDGVPTSVTSPGASVFVRTDIVSTRNSYPRDPARTDCAGVTCTYAEEMTNFANWYAYYKSRNQMMKTAVGQAFQPVTDKYNVGIVSLSTAAAEGGMNIPKPFAGQDRANWYDRLYQMSTSGSTPVRQALHAIGKMYANQSPYNYAKGAQAIEFACQQNFTFITTDGYWNGGAPSVVVSNDNKEDKDRFCLQGKGCVDTTNQSAPTLADVSLYWYNGGSNAIQDPNRPPSLRPTLEDYTKAGLVPGADGENTRLHMKTYALGLGVDGIMTYEQDYDKAPVEGGDFANVVANLPSGCPWNNNGRWIWPDADPEVNSGSAALQSRVDDLWHAAINGHGKYFSASDPVQVIDGLRQALNAIEVQVGAASAGAVSSPNIGVGEGSDNAFSTSFTTVKWTGHLAKSKIDTVSGTTKTVEDWNTSSTLGLRVDADTDSRRILMLDPKTKSLENFDYLNLDNAVERGWFDNKCSALTQCVDLKDEQRAIVNKGANIIGWLRGQQQYADDKILRAYPEYEGGSAANGAVPVVLGDIASSKPFFVQTPLKRYAEQSYVVFKEDKRVKRSPAVYVGANDGMLHAFDATTGEELWAYVPRITMKKLHLLASTSYATSHQYTVDGSPDVADVQINGEWRSVLVAGLNGGGRGYYALDVTDPKNPKALWELCADKNVCTGDSLEPEIGFTYGNPAFGTLKFDGQTDTWVVVLSSGYNNVPGEDGVDAGSGKGYLFVVDIATGKVRQRISTNVGDTTTPSGLTRLTASVASDPFTDHLVTDVYAGDLTGKMWRFNLNAPGAPKLVLMGDAGVDQPITTRPEVTLCTLANAATGDKTLHANRIVAFATGRLLDLTDVPATATQSLYVLKNTDVGIGANEWRKDAAMAKRTLKAEANDTFSIGGAKVDLRVQKGWYIDLTGNKGERVNLDPKLVFGTLGMVTNVPSTATECSVGGSSYSYQFNLCLGEAVKANDIVGKLLSPSAVVGFNVVRLPDGSFQTVAVTADGRKHVEEFFPAETPGARRTGWRRVRD